MSLLRVEGLTVRIGEVVPVDGVSLSIDPGQALCLLGESGSGKSMTALALMRLLPAGGRIAAGSVEFEGKRLEALPEASMRRLRGQGMAMIFQEPQTSLNPVMTIGQQIAEALPSTLSPGEQRKEVLRLLDEVGIPEPSHRIHSYPFELSGGQKQRVMIAQALAGNPRLLIADEPTTALDVTLQAQILDLVKRLARERNMALLLITHDLGVARYMSDRIAVMYAGQLVETLPVRAESGLEKCRHPYSLKLMDAVPSLQRTGQRLAAIAGRVPALNQVFSGCRFADRCEHALPACTAAVPGLLAVDEDHQVRCIRARESLLVERHGTDTLASAVVSETKQVLSVRNLSVSFVQRTGQLFGKRELKAVDGIDLDLSAGETLALVGESGCGKTTAAKAILGLTPVSGGQVLLDGHPVAGLSERRYKPFRRVAQIVFQDPYSSLNPRMLVGEILAEGMHALKVEAESSLGSRVAELLEKVGLAPEAADQYPHEFSGGQRQRIAIARALAVRPRVLICDEPTSALDVSVQAQILNLLAALQREEQLAMLFITHNLAAVGYLAHRVAVMQAGKIVESGTTREILTQPRHPYTQRLLAAVI
jgi:peptide/nickel transport system ATP-binding protein